MDPKLHTLNKTVIDQLLCVDGNNFILIKKETTYKHLEVMFLV